MGKPCGCAGSCGCDIRGRGGVRVSGSGIAPDTMWIELDGSSPDACNTIMTCVGANLGNGLGYNPATGDIFLRLAAGENQATIGPDGGLLVTGSGGGGGGGGQTVANLPTGNNTIVGSTWGAGSSMWPEGILASIQAARNMAGTQIRMVHIPVRCTSDEFPICLSEPSMGWYMQDGNSFSPREFEHREHSNVIIAPGGSPTPSIEGGYWGFFQDPSKGSPTLGEALDLLARRVVIVAEVRDTINPGTVADRIKALVPQYEAQSCVIVAGEPVASSGPVGPTIVEAVSASISGSGMPVGVVLRTKQQVTNYTVAYLNSLGVTWVFMHQDLVDPFHPNYAAGAAEAYRAAGFNVMLTWVNRQYQAQRATALQLRGSLCTDPIYAYGAGSAWRYRRDTPSWGFSYANVGQHSPWSDTVSGQGAHYRGFVNAGQAQQLTIKNDLRNPEQVEPYPSAYWILPGELLPLRNADTYAVQCFWRWDDGFPADRTRFVALWLDAPTDRSLREWSAATAQTIGYLFLLTSNGDFILVEYDGTPGVPPASRVLGTWATGYTMAANNYYGMRAEVTPTAIRLYASSQMWPNPFNKVLIATISNPHRYITGVNQGYVYFGRHYWSQADSRTNKIAGLAVQYSGF